MHNKEVKETLMLKRTLTIFITVFAIVGSFGCKSTSNDRSAGEVIDDAVIVSTIKAKLLSDSEVSGLDIDVDSEKGEVVLTGTVNTEAESTKAADIARQVNGVVSVKNSLVVKPSQNDGKGNSYGK
jgi:hyperosmotically inducible protein